MPVGSGRAGFGFVGQGTVVVGFGSGTGFGFVGLGSAGVDGQGTVCRTRVGGSYVRRPSSCEDGVEEITPSREQYAGTG